MLDKKTMTNDEKIALKRYCQEIINNPRPLDAQRCEREGKYVWCEDWEIIEQLKCMFLGKEEYFKDTPPRRLKGNPMFSKDEIISDSKDLIEDYKTAEKIIEHLRVARKRTA